MRLQGKVAVVTGAGSGMGRAMAEVFAEQGAKVVVGEWNEASMNDVVAAIRNAGGDAIGVRVNVAVQAEAEALIDTAVKQYGRIDILVNNAGVMDNSHGVGELPDEMWKRVMSINVDGPMYLSRKAVQAMLPQGSGSIINIASAAAFGGGPAGAAYVTSKHAVVGLTKSTAWMYCQKGIRCNAICPGGVETNITQSIDMSKMDPFGAARNMAFNSIVPGMLKPRDIAELALFLASDESRLINGAIIPADAGWRAA